MLKVHAALHHGQRCELKPNSRRHCEHWSSMRRPNLSSPAQRAVVPSSVTSWRIDRRFKRNATGDTSYCKAASTVGEEASDLIEDLLDTVKGTQRGVNTSESQKRKILSAVRGLEKLEHQKATTSRHLDATWKLLWTTEKETLFIIKNAKRFGTEAGDVYQVIDSANCFLQNVITFQNGASFVVDSSLKESGNRRLAFKFTSAKLNLPNRSWKIPPFGKGWFDTVYVDDELRIAKDIRGDTLVVLRDGPPRQF